MGYSWPRAGWRGGGALERITVVFAAHSHPGSAGSPPLPLWGVVHVREGLHYGRVARGALERLAVDRPARLAECLAGQSLVQLGRRLHGSRLRRQRTGGGAVA